MADCGWCAALLHEFCTETSPIDGTDYVSCCCWNSEVSEPDESGIIGVFKKGIQTASGIGKDNASLRSTLSTGRKRAAALKPIPEEGTICEWAGLKFAGGGVKPIIGCTGTILVKQRGKYARHHGPDKSVLNNSESNLHLVCPTCHNRWHTLNDPYYGERPDEGAPFVPLSEECKQHDSLTKASPTEMMENEMWWASNPAKRVKDEDDERDDQV